MMDKIVDKAKSSASKTMNEVPRKAKAATMDEVKGQLKQLDEKMKTATTQAAKDEIKKHQDELKR
jgi:hypothetical protein